MPHHDPAIWAIRAEMTGDKVDGDPFSPATKTYKPTTREGKRIAEAISEARYHDADDDRHTKPTPSHRDKAMREAWLADQSATTKAREASRKARVTGSAAGLRALLSAVDCGAKAAADFAADRAMRNAASAARNPDSQCHALQGAAKLSGKPRVRK